jgi:hypothetical protein
VYKSALSTNSSTDILLTSQSCLSSYLSFIRAGTCNSEITLQGASAQELISISNLFILITGKHFTLLIENH